MVILLVAIVLLFVVGAMAVLAIDLVTFYTARSEAQLAADGAALAGARVLANSGMTSNPTVAIVANAENLARTVATKVAAQNKVGGRNLNAGEVNVSFQGSSVGAGAGSNPRVTVQVTRNDLPTFFTRIWGRTQVTVTASATAEAYNPSGLTSSGGPPIAPVCVKPWVLPNLDPRNGSAIFNTTTGDILDPTRALLGADPTVKFRARCEGGCDVPPPPAPPPTKWQYYAGDQSSFPAPTQSLPTCNGPPLNAYQKSIAGCVQTPISCNSTVNLDLSPHPNRDTETGQAVSCLTHSVNDKGDSIDTSGGPNPPFQFVAGDDNPVVAARGSNVLVSDSLVTVPVYDSSVALSGTVQVIGFVQLFLNPDGETENSGHIETRVVNLVGCGTNATGQAVLGNGASAIPVRLVSP